MKKNKISPLEELRQEKVMVKKEVEECEDRLAESWLYLTDNAGSLLLQGAVNGILHKFGFGGSHKKIEAEDREHEGTSSGIGHGIINTLSAYSPMIWEMVQPMLIQFAVNKFKSIFTRKKKKKKKRKDDDD